MTEVWHFVGETLRDGRPIPPDGETLVHDGPVVPCKSGFHGSERIIDALRHAPGGTICRVWLGGTILPHGDPVDKLVGSERTILWRIDGDQILRRFAREQALSVTSPWDVPTLRDAARAAAWNAAWDAAGAAALDAARAAAWNAAWDAAGAAARDAAWAAARAAAWDAANDRLTAMVMEARERCETSE